MSVKRLILMYISEVSGHHSATLAIEETLRRLEPQAEILNINAFNYTNPISEKIVNRLYMGVIKRTPQVWEYLYDNIGVAKKIENIKRLVHKLNSPKLKNLFDRFKPDCVICSQAFPCGMVADFKKVYGSDIPLVAVLTDYIPHSYWIYNKVDFYISPSEEVSERLIQKGVPQQKIKTFGIPFDPKFNEPIERNKVIKKLRLEQKLPIVLIMGGGQGLGPIKTILRSLEKIKLDFQGVVVAGANRKLYRNLKRKVKKYGKRISVLGYVDYINELMSISDIIITKPGGITTAEALAQRLPIVIVKPLPGQEANNTEYLIRKEAAVRVNQPRDTHAVIEDLLKHPDKLESLKEAARRISKPNASLDIARLVLSL
jgi:processive 1,2-diacylglycerol beta-glucosyltransferase